MNKADDFACDFTHYCAPSGRCLCRVRTALTEVGLKPTRQRMALCKLLFREGDRHVSAESLHAEAVAAGERIALSTVYNTLRALTEAGLLREVAAPGGRSRFDTNTADHSHFHIAPASDSGKVANVESRLIDIPQASVRITGLPAAPEGHRISHVDVVVHLVAK